MKNLNKQFNRIIEASRFLKSIKRVKEKKGRSVLFGNSVRRLTSKEIRVLEKNGNHSDDWSLIAVCEDFSPDRIINSFFFGKCVIGNFTHQAELISPGIYSSTIVNSEIGNNALIYNCGAVINYIIENNAIIRNTKSISQSGTCSFGNGRELSIGIETGGREVLSFAELTIDTAVRIATERSNKELISAYNSLVNEYTSMAQGEMGIVEKGAKILNSVKIANSFIGEYVLADGALLIENSTILSGEDEKTEIKDGAYVKNSCIQWGCDVTSMALVENSVLTEHSHVERHGKVTDSIIGPNTGIAEGEVTSSLVGPFVGFHHQSLLIAALWPEGKGNVGYGANVGSNHTSKAPDQEIFCGEGTFFGLGVNIKFPSDFSGAPYSIIATGVSALPQKVEFPFSLINEPAMHFPGFSPAYNEIFPAWVLSDNIYTVIRNEGKYRKRNKARRTQFIFDVFRPDIVEMMLKAREVLSSVPEKKDIYLDRDIRGIGKNYLLEENRTKAIETYSFYIRYYALKSLKRVLDNLSDVTKKISESSFRKSIADNSISDPQWEYEKKILKNEGLLDTKLKQNMEELLSMEKKIAEDTEESKTKDDKRGNRIIKDYSSAHKPAPEDSFVKQTWEQYKILKEEIENYDFSS